MYKAVLQGTINEAFQPALCQSSDAEMTKTLTGPQTHGIQAFTEDRMKSSFYAKCCLKVLFTLIQ